MYKIDFTSPLHIHFIGIGGISMSGLAEILIHKGFFISGSDSNQTEITKHLESLGAKIMIGQSAENINASLDAIVYTAAISEDNPELVAAKKLNIPLITRAQLLGQIMNFFEESIAIAGTHGKTTTTGMVSHILLEAKADPTISIGGILPAIQSNIRIGDSNFFLTEACEYTNSFWEFSPKVAVILNIEEDHLDFFKNLDEIYDSFHRFTMNIKENDFLILNEEIERKEIFNSLPAKVFTYGFSDTSDFVAKNLSYDDLGNSRYDLYYQGRLLTTITLNVRGKHNVSNSLGAFASTYLLGIEPNIIARGLESFNGTGRRFEYKGDLKGVHIVDDYAHHPTEIKATFETSQLFPHRQTWCVFQPHTYTRTKSFLKEFAQALSSFDHVILAPIYAAREIDTLGISSKDLHKELLDLDCDAYYFDSFDEIETFLLLNCVNNDLLITMGAGDIGNLGKSLLGK